MGTTGSSSTTSSSSSSALSHILSSKNKMKKASSSSSKKKEEGYVRRAHHAGSWYSSSPQELDAQLTSFLSDAEAELSSSSSSKNGKAANGLQNGIQENGIKKTAAAGNKNNKKGVPRAIIAPHAGYSYSGPTAAFAYLALKEALLESVVVVEGEERARKSGIKTIVVLHPSHHVRLDKCAVSGASIIETPLLNLQCSSSLRSKLLSTNTTTSKFTTMTQSIDEQEHSGEMHYPYIAKCLLDSNLTSPYHPEILPIMVGEISTIKEELYGRQCLKHVLAQQDVFTIVSTDFCHWGKRFGYTPTSSSSTSSSAEQIYEYITKLDQTGMSYIEMQKPGAFAEYLQMYSNTICGRHPISVWLHAIRVESEGEGQSEESGLDVEFVKYAQSSQVVSMRESSVSYASAVARQR